MKAMLRKLTALTLCLLLALLPAAAMAAEYTIYDIQKYGNIILAVTGTDFLAEGFEYGDIVTVQVGDQAIDMPVGSNYSDVDEGSPVCRVVVDPESGSDAVVLAINMGDLATLTGVAVKTAIEAEPGYRWDYCEGFDETTALTVSIKEKGGYLAEYMLRNLIRTNERADYAHLTDAQFANFRAVATTGMGEGKLYRSSSPVNPELGRNAFADAALKEAGVKTIVNLADSEASLTAHEGYADTAYAACSILPLNLGIDFEADDFKAGLAEGLRFIAANEGPYLVHCTEGKDRAGFTSALLECLMGASAEEVIADYMTTYFNYYGTEPGSEQYEVIADSNVRGFLARAFGVDNIADENVNLAEEAETFLAENLGLTAAEIEAVKANLS